MFKRAISILIVLVLLPQLTACVSLQAVNVTGVLYPGSQETLRAITVTVQQADFDEPSTEVSNDLIYATVDQNPYEVAGDQVEQLEVPDEIMPLVVIIGALGVLMLIGLALWSS